MKRVITSLSLLLLLLCGATAQSISQYEYWTDDDYASRTVGSATGNDVLLNVSTATLEAGVHFLNFRAYRDDGVWGNFYRYLYYIPTLKSEDAPGDLTVEYWLDDYLAGVQREAANGGNLSLTIDVSTLAPGVHYLNCTPVTSTGGRGNSERYLFYVPQSFDLVPTSPIKGFEYWIDDDYVGKKVDNSGSMNPVFTIGIAELASGVHYFNCRAVNERGEYGNPVREMFYIPEEQTFDDATLASYEYWIDDDYAHCVRGSSADAEQAFTVDVSQLASGVHYFNYLPIDNKGRRGHTARQMFYMANTTDPSASEQITYEYWIDDDTSHKVKGKGTTGENTFRIDLSALDNGTHTFNFKAKNLLEQWGEQYSETFDFVSTYAMVDMLKDTVTYTSSYALDFTSPIEGLKAYVVSEVNAHGKAVLKEVTTAVPAGTGLILMGTSGQTYDIPYSWSMPDAIQNMLVGVTSDTLIGASGLDYILKSGRFVKATTGTIKAGKAYLRLETAQTRDAILIDAELTGVSEVIGHSGEDIERYYNISGQRIFQPKKGLYILKGKKVIIK